MLNVTEVRRLSPDLALRDGLLAWTERSEGRVMAVELPRP